MKIDRFMAFVLLAMIVLVAVPASAASGRECGTGVGAAVESAAATAEPAAAAAPFFALDPVRPLDLVVSCDTCTQPRGPGFQCNRQCRALGLCVDQCYASDDCQSLVSCICLSC